MMAPPSPASVAAVIPLTEPMSNGSHSVGRRFSGSQAGCSRVSRLVETDVAAPWQAEPGQSSPSLLGDAAGELDALGLQLLHRRVEVVAHEIQLVRGRTVRGMHRNLGRRQLEDEPAAAGVDVRLPE